MLRVASWRAAGALASEARRIRLLRGRSLSSARPWPKKEAKRAHGLLHSRSGTRTRASAASGSDGKRQISQDEFTEKAWEALTQAPQVASRCEQQVVETEHLLKALLEQEDSVAARAIKKAGASGEEAGKSADQFIAKQPQVQGAQQQVLGRNLETAVEHARSESGRMGDKYVACEHLLLAIAHDKRFGEGMARQLGLTSEKLEEAIREMRGGKRVEDQKAESSYEALSKYARDLTEAARNGKLDPVIGRDDEIRRTVQILSRRTKNNPVLIGEPGVGKTAIVEALAQRIVAGDVPSSLMNRKLMALDMGSLMAGAKYRGEFEDRVKAVVSEVQKEEGRIILFIDEIHTVIGSGGGEGSGGMDASNLLKPPLARGELRCIGATTLDEYRRHIEKDPALERRLQKVMVEEPGVEETVSILRGLKERYELHHGVRISDTAIVEAAQLSDQYISDRYLPDKAIDLVDEAAAKLKMEVTSKPAALDEVDRQLMRLEMERLSLSRAGVDNDRATQQRLQRVQQEMGQLQGRQKELQERWEAEKAKLDEVQRLKEEIDSVQTEIGKAEREYDLNRAAELKYGSLMQLQQRLQEAESELERANADESAMLREEVTEADISEVISKWTGIPLSRLLQSEKDKLLALPETLSQRVVGQEEAINKLSEAVQRSRAGMSDPTRPIAAFLFLGPTGVGKTEVAKALAESLFGDESAIARVDMSEYMERFSVSRLIGAPPGYVGHEEGGQLTEQVRRHPYSVVLLDEVEKAHEEVCNVLLQMLGDGRLTDGRGREVSFRNCIIIMTSNLGAEHLLTSPFDQAREAVLPAARGHFRPELVNRMDDLVVFQPLSRDAIERVVRIHLAAASSRLASRKISMTVSDEAVAFLAEQAYDPSFGARPVRRTVQDMVETPMARGILSGQFAEDDAVHLSVSQDRSSLEFARNAEWAESATGNGDAASLLGHGNTQ